MRQVSAALRAAIDSGERIINSTFTVDWDNDGIQDIDDLSHKIDQVSVNQSLESSLPTQVQLVPGVAVAELTARMARGNTVRYSVASFFRELTTSSVASGSTPTWTIARPTSAKVGDVVLVAIFVSMGSFGSTVASWQVLTKSNVTWLPISVRGDGGSGSTRIEAILLHRRVDVNEPSTYDITLPNGSAVLYGSAAVCVGDQYLMGVTDFVQKGEDYVDAPTSITLPQIRVDVPNSTIVSFFGAASYAVSGIGFTPLDALNDVEQTEFTVNGGPASKPSLRVGVTTHSNAAQGYYQKGVTFSGSAGSSNIATIGFSIVLTPKLAGDEAQHAAWTFSELNPNSPYAGKTRLRRKTRWLLNFVTESGRQSVPLFTGYTTAPSGSSDRTVTIKALDNRETMRNTSQGLNIVAEYPVSQDTISGSSLPTLPGLEATWMVSRLFFMAFRTNRVSSIFTYESQLPWDTGLGYFASPIGSRYAGVWATMHGSAHHILPDVALIQYAYTETSTHALRHRVAYEVGPFVAATKNEGVGFNTVMSWAAGNWVVWNQAVGQLIGRVQCWVRRNATTSSLKIDFPDNNGNIWDAWVEVTTAGVVRLRVEKPSVSRTITGPTIAADATWHFLGVHFDSVAGSVTFRVDNTNTVVALSTWSNATISIMLMTVNVTISDGMQLAEFQSDGGYSSGGSATGIALSEIWANENFTPTAFIDKSENIIDVIPYIDVNVDSFSIVSDIAAAEFAAFFFDADGYPHYRTSRSDVSTTGQTIQRLVTSRRSIKSIAYESGVLQIRNIISVGYTPFVASINAEIFTASGVIIIHPGETLTFSVIVQGSILQINAPTYTAYSQSNGAGTNLTGLINVALTEDNGLVTIAITNNAGVTAYMVDNTGQANVHVTATYMSPLSNTNSVVTYTDSDSIREFGEQTLDLGNTSIWVQREESAASIALKLLSDLCQPHPAITSLSIKGDPTLEFGDLVTVQDTNGLGVNGQYRITCKDPQINAGDGFTQSLVVRSAPTIAYWDTNFWDDGTVWG